MSGVLCLIKLLARTWTKHVTNNMSDDHLELTSGNLWIECNTGKCHLNWGRGILMVDLSKSFSSVLDFYSRTEGGRFFSKGKNLLMQVLNQNWYVCPILKAHSLWATLWVQTVIQLYSLWEVAFNKGYFSIVGYDYTCISKHLQKLFRISW